MSPSHEHNRQQIRERLLRAGLKATQQRIVILEALLNLHDCHPTAEEVFQRLNTDNPGISLGTVYKTLDSFVALALVKRVFSGNSRRYDSSEHTHGHIYCLNTKEIIDFSDPELDKLVQDFFRAKQFENFTIRDISIQIVGSKANPDQHIKIN